MSLTRNQWIEMWATLKAMEYDLLHFPRCNSPFVEREQTKLINDTLNNIVFVKSQIQLVIGQME
jgi:hypothetical protein